MKVKKYIIVRAEWCEQLESRVNELIKKGWMPTGGPMVDGSCRYYQAMILTEENTLVDKLGNLGVQQEKPAYAYRQYEH